MLSKGLAHPELPYLIDNNVSHLRPSAQLRTVFEKIARKNVTSLAQFLSLRGMSRRPVFLWICPRSELAVPKSSSCTKTACKPRFNATDLSKRKNKFERPAWPPIFCALSNLPT